MLNFNNTFEELSQLYESVLELDTPYMLRNDGQLISCKELLIHPYINILPSGAKSKTAAYKFLLNNGEADNYRWFLKYTNNSETKALLTQLLSKTEYIDIDLDRILNKLRFNTNQEFCRVRTSGKFLGNRNNHEIYFRISSFNFNWFDLIWRVVYENRQLLSNVTICTDERAKGYDQSYLYRGVEIAHLPTTDFINLPGRPIIERVYSPDKAITALAEDLDMG